MNRQSRIVIAASIVSILIIGTVTPTLKSNLVTATTSVESLGHGRTVYIYADTAAQIPEFIPPPTESLRTASQSTNIVIDYIGTWDPQAQAAFEYAVGIWEGLIVSPVQIVVEAEWSASLPPGALGGAGPYDYYRGFSGAPQANTWYPVALANKLHGSDLALADPDINAAFNSTFPNWYFGTDGNPAVTQYDFSSVVLHELCHGLGFAGSMQVVTGVGSWGFATGYPFIYDRFTQNGAAISLLQGFPNPSSALAAQLTSNDVWFDGTNANAANGGQRVKLYAPASWRQGSSYSHLDEIFNGSPNALMTYSINNGEANHNPGPVTLGMFMDTGWTSTPGPPATPTLSTISNLDQDGDYEVGWSSVSGADSYELQEQYNSVGWSTIYTGTGTSRSLTGQAVGTWCYQVRASNSGGSSGWSNVECSTVDTPPASPAAPTLSTISNPDQDGDYEVEWSSVSGADSYALQEQHNDGEWSTIYTGTGTSRSLTGQAVGTWCYQVRASNSGGLSSWSNVSCTTVVMQLRQVYIAMIAKK